MIKQCEYCGKDFEAKTIRRQFCSDVCRTRKHRGGLPSKIMPADEEVVKAYAHLKSSAKVAEELGVASSWVLKVLKRNGVELIGHKNQAAKHQKVPDAELIEACKTLSSGEIQKKFGIRQCTLYERCVKLGIRPVKKKQEYNHAFDNCKNKAQLWKGIWHYHEPHAKKFADVDGVKYLESKGTVARIECEVCGHIYEVGTRKDSNFDCRECRKRQQDCQALQQSRSDLIRTLNRLVEYKKLKECACCGAAFRSANARRIYCSNRCKLTQAARNNPKSQSYRGRCRRYGSHYDSSVKREAVIKRDKGVCQICGKQCDPNDKSWGTSGPDYPTLDHIRPLSKGGTHTWDNVQCACGMCNSEKRDLLYG